MATPPATILLGDFNNSAHLAVFSRQAAGRQGQTFLLFGRVPVDRATAPIKQIYAIAKVTGAFLALETPIISYDEIESILIN